MSDVILEVDDGDSVELLADNSPSVPLYVAESVITAFGNIWVEGDTLYITTAVPNGNEVSY